MAEPVGEAPAVPLPERIDRRARLGPFPSARDAARFLCYAATGAVLAPFVSPFLWLPVVGAGFVVSVWQPDGRPADERLARYAFWRVRSWAPGGTVSPRPGAAPRHGLVRVAPDTFAAIVRTTGCPIAYLPPAELELKFGQYRELLRGLAGAIAILSTATPARANEVRPGNVPLDGPEREACSGYADLAERLCRRRRTRRVYLAIRNAAPGPDAVSRLDAEARSLADGLPALGVRATRLTGHALAEAAGRFGWTSEAATFGGSRARVPHD